MIELWGLNQGTKEWLNWRDGGIGGSEAPVIMLGDVYGKTPYGLWMKKMGLIQSVNFTQVQQAHLDRGHALEPKAREEFIKRTGIQIEPLCCQSSRHPYMFASLDGINASRDVIAEIKAPAEPMMLKILAEGIPVYYYDQVQHQIEVSDAREAYFCAYNPEVPPYVYIELIRPDYARIQEIIRKEGIFWKHVELGTPPWTGELGLDKSPLGIAGLTMFAGYAKVGKDTIGALHQHMFKTVRYAFADSLKRVCGNMKGVSVEYLEKHKEKYRADLVSIGHGMREIASDIWVDGVFNITSGIYQSMTGVGAIITDCRYVNEASAGRKHAARLNVPSRVVWVERPGVGPANEQEEKSTSLLRGVSDIILVNDLDARQPEHYAAMEKALLRVMEHVPEGKQLFISASDFLPMSAKKLKPTPRKKVKKNDAKRSSVRRAVKQQSRGKRNRKVS